MCKVVVCFYTHNLFFRIDTLQYREKGDLIESVWMPRSNKWKPFLILKCSKPTRMICQREVGFIRHFQTRHS